jgi:hypothetical protein
MAKENTGGQLEPTEPGKPMQAPKDKGQTHAVGQRGGDKPGYGQTHVTKR